MATRIIVVGAGAIASAHLTAVSSTGRAEVTWLVDVHASRADDLARRRGVPRWGTSLEQALDNGADLVVLCTPPRTHVTLAAVALEAGVAVLTEKPPTRSLAEMDELLETEARTHGRVGVVFQHRFGSAGRRAAQMLAPGPDGGAGPLGRPMVALCNTLWFRGSSYFEVPWRGRWDEEGGGTTLGHGIHQLDLMLALLGPWTEVRAMAARLARDTDTEDVSTALVRFQSGALATIVNTVLSPREVSALRVDTDRATLELEHLYAYDETNWRLTAAPGHEAVEAAWAADAQRHCIPSSHKVQLEMVLDALTSGAPLPVPLSETRPTMELVTAIYASAFTGGDVRAGDIVPGHPFYRHMFGNGTPWPPRKPPRRA
jgi:predicted dehydrogenase